MIVIKRRVFLIVCMVLLCLNIQAQETNIRTKGFFTFKSGGIKYNADTTHARAYGTKHGDNVFLSAANKENMIFNVKWSGFHGVGTYLIYKGSGEVELVLNSKTYNLVDANDFLKITITGIKEKGSLLLLNGNFEGRLQDKKNNKTILTDGKFETYHL